MTSVTLLLFSGRRDSTWELPARELEALKRWLEGRRARSSGEAPALGYRGFLVRSDDPGMPPEVVVRDSPELERFLLATAGERLPAEVIPIVEAAIARR